MTVVTKITDASPEEAARLQASSRGQESYADKSVAVEDDGDANFVDEDDNDAIAHTDDDDYEDEEDDDADDEFDPSKETVVQRLCALVDIVPPMARAKIYINLRNAASRVYDLGMMAGTAAWVIGTASLLVALPVGLELEREQFILQQEAQARAVENSSKGAAVAPPPV